MKGGRKALIGLVCLGLLIASCQGPEATENKVSVRATLTANAATKTLDVRASMESSEGFALDGGVVAVITPGNQSVLLDFDQSRSCYGGQIASPVAGSYRIRFRSAALPEKELVVPFVPITGSPVLQIAQDSAGHSAFLGEDLSLAEAISLEWSPCEGATAYLVTIYQNGTASYSASVSVSNLLIAPGTLDQTGTASIRVVAQTVAGDPLLARPAYYSVSEASGSLFYLRLVP